MIVQNHLRKCAIFLLFTFVLCFTQTIQARSSENTVILYGTSWCGYCHKTRQLLHHFGIEFTDYDIEASEFAKQKYDALHTPGVPIVIIGSTQINGYHPKAIEQALRENGLIQNK